MTKHYKFDDSLKFATFMANVETMKGVFTQTGSRVIGFPGPYSDHDFIVDTRVGLDLVEMIMSAGGHADELPVSPSQIDMVYEGTDPIYVRGHWLTDEAATINFIRPAVEDVESWIWATKMAVHIKFNTIPEYTHITDLTTAICNDREQRVLIFKTLRMIHKVSVSPLIDVSAELLRFAQDQLSCSDMEHVREDILTRLNNQRYAFPKQKGS